MNSKNLVVFFILSLLVVSVVFVFVPTVKAQEPQEHSFGNPTLPPIATMNWTKFWSLFNTHSDWDLEYNDGSGWKTIKSDLQIIKDYRIFIDENWVSVNKSEASNCKITLNFTASYSANYRLTFGIDLDVKNYTHKEGSWNYTISYQNYTVCFDWSDIKEIPNLIVTHGVKPVGDESWFWFRIRKDNVPKGKNVLIDPNFGNTTLEIYLLASISDSIQGSVFTITEAGTADSITAGLRWNIAAWTGNIKCAIYLHSTLGLVANGVTEQRNIALTSTRTWYSFNFVGTKPDLTANTAYVLVVWAQSSGDGLACIMYGAGDADQGHYQSKTYNAFPDSLVPTHTTNKESVYCTYTPSAGGYALNLRVMDWDLTDAISGAIVYKDTDTKTSNGGGWANWTGVSGTVAIQVKYFGFWVNGSFSVTMNADKTINVKCKLYDVTVTAKPNNEIGIVSGANVTAYNNTSTSNGKIKTGITVDTTGQITLTNLPNNTLRFIIYAKSDYSIVIANTTQLISSDDYSFNIIANQNYATATLSFGYEAIIWMSNLSLLAILSIIVHKTLKKLKGNGGEKACMQEKHV